MGRYNYITRKVIRDIYGVLNHTYTKYELDSDEFYETGLWVDSYEDRISGLEFDLELQLEVNNEKYGDIFIIDGCVFTDPDDVPFMILKIGMGRCGDKKIHSELYPELRDAVRHEIEHLTQRGYNRKEGKYVRNNDLIRQKIAEDIVPMYKYFLLKDEVDANIHGLYSKAKALKKPFHIVIDEYLDELIDKKVIQKENKETIYKTWKRRIPEIGGIPQLK